MLEKLLLSHYEAAAIILAGIGLTNLLLQRSIIKKIIGFNIMNSAVFLFLAAKGYAEGRAAPVLIQAESGGWITDPSVYVNPVPAGLVLMLMVISAGITAFALALTLKLYEHYGTLNIDEALLKMTEQQEEAAARISESEGDVMA